MAVNSVRNKKSAERMHDFLEILEKEKDKKSPRWKDAVKRGLKNIEGLSPRNVADCQTAFLITHFPERIETDLYQIAREFADEET